MKLKMKYSKSKSRMLSSSTNQVTNKTVKIKSTKTLKKIEMESYCLTKMVRFQSRPDLKKRPLREANSSCLCSCKSKAMLS